MPLPPSYSGVPSLTEEEIDRLIALRRRVEALRQLGLPPLAVAAELGIGPYRPSARPYSTPGAPGELGEFSVTGGPGRAPQPSMAEPWLQPSPAAEPWLQPAPRASQGAPSPSPLQAGPQYRPRATGRERGAAYDPRAGMTLADRIFNALGAAGVGLSQGKASLGPVVESRLALRKAQQDEAEAAQKGMLQQAQIMDYGFKALTTLKPMAMQNPEFLEGFVDLLVPLFKAAGHGAEAPDETLADTTLKATIRSALSGKVNIDAMVSGYTFLTDDDKATVGMLFAQGHGDKALDWAAKKHTFREGEARTGMIALLERVRGQNLPLEEFFKTLTPESQQAVRQLMVGMSDKERERLGIPSKALELITAEKEAGEVTKKGKAELGLIEARTRESQIAAKMAPVKTLPGPGAALADISGALGLPGTQSGVQPPGGMTAAPGVNIIASTPPAPGPGIPIEAAKTISSLEGVNFAISRARAAFESGKVSQYMGGHLTGARAREWFVRSAPGFKVPPELVDVDQAEQEIKNAWVVYRTGAAVGGVGEEARLFNELPDRSRQKPEEWLRKLEIVEHLFPILAQRVKEMVGPDGRQKVFPGTPEGDALARKYPIPPLHKLEGKKKEPLKLVQ